MTEPVIVSHATKSLVIPSTGMTKTLFPDAPSLADGRLVLPHGPREFMILKRLGYKVPNPIMYYDWNGGTPFSVQKATCALLTSNTHAYVLNEMGTGKTKSALWAWDYLRGNRCAQKALVVAPLSTLNFVWSREVFDTIPHRRVQVLHGSKQQRLDNLADTEADVYVINHDGLDIIWDAIAARSDIDTLIIDELAVYRNDSQRSKHMRKAAKKFTWVWGMTGAPMPNEPTDVWAQVMIVTPSQVPGSRRFAKSMLMTQINKFKWIPKPDAVATAFAMMQPAVRFSMDDVTELPPTVYQPLDVGMSVEQNKVYTHMLNHYCVGVQNGTITAQNAGVAMSKLLQIAGGWVYAPKPTVVKLDNQPRIDALLDIIAGADRKVIVFAPFTHAVLGLSEILEKNKIEHAMVHGQTPSKQRDAYFSAFQNTTKYKVLLAHPRCLAHGLTLTAAATVVWWAPTTSLEIYEQANARIIRTGQKFKQHIIHLQSSAVEKKIYRMLEKKQAVQNKLLEMFEASTVEIAA